LVRINLKPTSYAWLEQLVRFGPYIITGLLFVILPLLVPLYLQSMLSKVLIFAIFALSLNLIWGYTGLMSLGHAAYFGMGAYTSAILVTHYGIENFWISSACSILMAGLLAAVFGIIALRVSGLYFLLVTLALGQLVYYVAVAWEPMTGGMNGIIGIPRPDLGIPGFTWNATYFYFFVLLALIICFFLLYRMVKSPFGHALQGIRESETRMRVLGYNTWLYKYIAFIVGGLFAGVAGVLFSYFLGVVGPGQASVTTSTIVLLIVIIGSTRVFWGPVIGAVVVVLLEYFASLYAPARWPLILGGVFVISVMFLRGGISLNLLRLWGRVGYQYGSAKG